ncbi:unnamed protein product, partial [Effrenium voratum]
MEELKARMDGYRRACPGRTELSNALADLEAESQRLTAQWRELAAEFAATLPTGQDAVQNVAPQGIRPQVVRGRRWYAACVSRGGKRVLGPLRPSAKEAAQDQLVMQQRGQEEAGEGEEPGSGAGEAAEPKTEERSQEPPKSRRRLRLGDGTPMWQLAQGREATMRKEREAREAQAGDVLDIDSEAERRRSNDHVLMPWTVSLLRVDVFKVGGVLLKVLYVSKMVGDKYEDAKVRGPRRKRRAEAIKDGLELRSASRDAPKDARLEAAQKRSVELLFTTWKPEELPKDTYNFEELVEKPMKQRLARKPRGNGWQRVGDK